MCHNYFFLFLFQFLNYESMITYLQKTWKVENKVTYSSTMYYKLLMFLNIKFNIKFLVRGLRSHTQRVVAKRKISRTGGFYGL